MALGDAIALCLMEAKGFGADDFARNHPGGTLGKRLTIRVSDLVDSDRLFGCSNSQPSEVLLSMTLGRYGATVVIDSGTIVGVITDGDLRRASKPATLLQRQLLLVLWVPPLNHFWQQLSYRSSCSH